MKNNKIIGLLTIVSIGFIISGCGQPKPLYTYGNYSSSYYESKKDVDTDTALELQKSIEYAIENANESRSGRVAPGMYANLGYIYLKGGKTDKAIENFNKEKSIYPESAHFMDRMIKKIELAEGKTDNEK
ncbi:DUF4810 domain-containing protein [Sulfurimonas sp.]|uniref:DUF4810 domain-containing protein n=1 Tax=Sulfurimonas sp. TaxID=2022749 RepID=UPI002B467C4B|nr:DUF4810 domain-containing protein [Sulfurimonas sp.]